MSQLLEDSSRLGKKIHAPSKAPPEPKFILKREMGHVHCFNFPINEDQNECTSCYVGTEDGYLYVWDLITLTPRLKQKVGASIQAIHFYNSTVITLEKAGLIRIFKLEDNEFIQIHPTIQTEGSFCKSLMIENLLFTAAKSIDVFNLETREKVKSFVTEGEKQFGMIMCLTEIVKNCKSHIMALHETGDGSIWDPSSSTIVDQISFKPEPLSATFNKNKQWGAVVGMSSTIQIFEVGGQISKIIYEIEVPMKINSTVVRTSPDGRIFVVGGSDGKLRCFSWRTLKLLAVLTEHNGLITEIRYCEQKISACCDRSLVASSADGVISFWDVY